MAILTLLTLRQKLHTAGKRKVTYCYKLMTLTAETSGQVIFLREATSWGAERCCGRPIRTLVCAEIPTSGPLEMVLGGMRENPDVIPLKSAPSVWIWTPSNT